MPATLTVLSQNIAYRFSIEQEDRQCVSIIYTIGTRLRSFCSLPQWFSFMSESRSFIPKLLDVCHHCHYSINPKSQYFLCSVTFADFLRRRCSIPVSFLFKSVTGAQNYCFTYKLNCALDSDQ
jgi:hypothetical protein